MEKFQREELDVIGDLIQSRAKRVIETSVTCFLVETKQKLWQILPLSTINCPSPYSCNRILKILFYLIKKNKLVLRSINIWWKFLVNFT